MKMNIVKKLLLPLVVVASIGGVSFATITPQTVAAAGTENPSCAKGFLTFPVWYRGIVNEDTCELKSLDANGNNLGNFIWHIALNIIEIAIMLVGYLAAIFIMYGGFRYVISRGSADEAAKAKETILHAVMGLILALVSVAIVRFIYNNIFGMTS
jgi:uncharacterized membrane protein